MEVHADDIRVPQEKNSLYFSVGILFFAVLFLSSVSCGWVLIAFGAAIVWVKIQQGHLLGNAVKVSDCQFIEVYEAARLAAEHLSMNVPDIFVRQDPTINAYALGFIGRKSVVLHSATVESLEKDELVSVIGHELTHIKLDHTNWTIIAYPHNKFHIPIISDIMGLIFNIWSKKAEYSCDRGAILASRNLEATVKALAKVAVGKQLVAKLNMDSLMNQKRDVECDDVSRFSERFVGHPYIVKRIHALQRYYESSNYKKLTL